MAALTDLLLASGETAMEPPVRTLRAGPVSVDYAGGFLRYLRVGGQEVLRMINFAVRDQDWNTVPFRVFDEELDAHADWFRLHYRARFAAGEIRYEADIEVDGRADGSLRCSFDGRALTAFKRNRIGFTVQHPLAGCVGERIDVIHTDGTEESGRFPRLIEGDVVFREIAGLSWSAARGVARLRFEGDVFEMEDQRNWTDASFKTYCTPLARPLPVAVNLGDEVHQRVIFGYVGSATDRANETAPPDEVQLVLDPQTRALPQVGIARSREVGTLDAGDKAALTTLLLSHYRCEVDLVASGWEEQLRSALGEAVDLSLPLELVLFLGEERELDALVRLCASTAARVKRVVVLGRGQKVTPADLLSATVRVLRRAFPGAGVGAGTDAFFAELNRARVAPEDLDFLTYSINPQVHAFDRASLVETLEAQPHTVASARAFAGQAEVQVSPITFRMRWNPNATSPRSVGADDVDVDLRQLSLFAAGWTLGSLAELAAAGVSAITFYETVGARGLMQARTPQSPVRFPAPAGARYPLYFLFRELAGATRYRRVHVSRERRVSALLLEGPEAARLLVANLTPETIQVRLPKNFSPVARRVLDVTSWRRLATSADVPSLATEPWSGAEFALTPFVFVALDGTLTNEAGDEPAKVTWALEP